jgi:signal transduction histidine kinase
LEDAKYRVVTSIVVIDTPDTDQATDTEKVVAEVSRKVTDLMDQIGTAKLKVNDVIKRDLISAMSREVRTPLNVVMGYAGILHDKLLGALNPEQEKAIGKVIGQTNDLSLIMSNIFETHWIDSGTAKAERHEIHVVGLLSELKSAYDFPLGKSVRIDWDYPADLPAIMSDAAKIRVILQNLISNGLRFTQEGVVTVSARYVSETSRLEFDVTDTGIGIPGESLEAIFEKFRQLNLSGGSILSGMGLGLYLVRTFTKLLGGIVSVHSEYGKGSIFTVSFPVARADTVVAAPHDVMSLPNTQVSVASASEEGPDDNILNRREL